jgi:general L-amino acid transport system substrate-binding protein
LKRLLILSLAALSLGLTLSSAKAADTLQTVRDRGHLVCGTSEGVPGFSSQDDHGVWHGFDTDLCRALAAAIFDDPDKIEFISLSSKDRLVSLQSGQIDVLPRTTTWTLSRNVGQGLQFTAINYYDGQGFMVRKSSGVTDVAGLAGASICVPQGTTTELNLADYFKAHSIPYQIVTLATPDDALRAYQSGRCDAYTTDASSLAGDKLKMNDAADQVILPEVISQEPLGAWVRQDDVKWYNLVRWTLFAMINAEQFGVTQANVEDMRKSTTNPEIRRMLGVDASYGQSLGVTNDWVVRIVKAVGNYGESFDRNLGAKSPLNLPRGPNRLWSAGGLQYSPPFR